MAQAIHRLQQDAIAPTLVLSHFCDHRDPQSQNPDLIFRNFIYQAASQSQPVLKNLAECTEYQEAKTKKRKCRPQEIERILLDVCNRDRNFVLVVDGLDECSEEAEGSRQDQKYWRS